MVTKFINYCLLVNYVNILNIRLHIDSQKLVLNSSNLMLSVEGRSRIDRIKIRKPFCTRQKDCALAFHL